MRGPHFATIVAPQVEQLPLAAVVASFLRPSTRAYCIGRAYLVIQIIVGALIERPLRNIGACQYLTIDLLIAKTVTGNENVDLRRLAGDFGCGAACTDRVYRASLSLPRPELGKKL